MALVNPGGRAPAERASGSHLGLLKGIVRATLALGESDAIVVQQLACAEPGCPPVETVVAVLAAPRRTWKFPCTADELTPDQLRRELRHFPKGREHDHS
ncbi:Nitrate reductase [Mycobacterium sp. smrl_JER01]